MPTKLTKFVMHLEKNIDLNKIVLSEHVKEHMQNIDKKHCYTEEDIRGVLELIKAKPVEPFEVATTLDGTRLLKFCVRVKLDTDSDISISYSPKSHKVITAWVNTSEDTHKTLDPTRYEQKII